VRALCQTVRRTLIDRYPPQTPAPLSLYMSPSEAKLDLCGLIPDGAPEDDSDCEGEGADADSCVDDDDSVQLDEPARVRLCKRLREVHLTPPHTGRHPPAPER
jgi:hypothetical protein